ncbi:MAG: hypothetical protein QOH61_993, partial [Chloroflexota bacterium]|nr:hypothetical protein [Chloroflexota bacterium]
MAACLAILLALLAGLFQSADASAASSAELRIRAPQHVRVGQPIRLRLSVVRAADVGGYEAAALFNPVAAHLNGAFYGGNGVEKRGRGIVPLGPVTQGRTVSFGFYSCPVADCGTTAGARHPRGPSGKVALGILELVPDRPGTLQIGFTGVRLTTAAGAAAPIGAPSAVSVRVGAQTTLYKIPAPAYPFGPAARGRAILPSAKDITGDGRVSNADAQEASLDWTLARNIDGPCAAAAKDTDVNGDGCIDVADVQAFAAGYTPGKPPKVPTPGDPPGGVTPALAPGAVTFTVNSTSDAADVTPGDGICQTATAGVCTLRAAMDESNRHGGPDGIAFNIAGSGVQTINLLTALPTITDETGSLEIDGYTQPGASPNTDALASNAVIRIAIVGGGDGVEYQAFRITSANNTIRGLAIYQAWRKVWIAGPGAVNNLVAGSFVGTNAAGTFASPAFQASSDGGILIDSTAHGNRIGDETLAGRNVVSGNQRSGVHILGDNTTANVVRNNIFGLAPNGLSRVANITHGLDVDQGARQNIVGGLGTLQRNVIAGSGGDGIEIVHHTTTVGNQVVGNYIGTDLTGNTGPAYARNHQHGVHVDDGAAGTIVTDNVVGNNGDPGSTGGGIVVEGQLTSGTIVARNRVGVSLNGTAIPNNSSGIAVRFHAVATTIGPANIVSNQVNAIEIGPEADVDRNKITQNTLSGNTGMGIEVYPAGINPNGHYIATGPNQALPFPELTSATPTSVSGRACASCVVEIFQSEGGANQFGEGRTFVGSATAAADSSFTATVSGLALGDYVTATATDANGNSSEFALNRPVRAAGVSPAGTLFASDAFSRTLTDEWRSAALGGPYTLSAPLADYDVANGTGTFVLPANAGRSALLSSLSERDVDVTVQVATDKVSAGTDQYTYLVLRRHENGNEYRAKVRFGVNGGIFVMATRVVGNVESGIGTEVRLGSLVRTAGQAFLVRAQATGASPTTLRMKVWPEGTLEPATWLYTQTNAEATLQSAGAIGLRVFAGSATTNAPITYSFDQLSARVPLPDDGVAPAAPQGLVATPGNNSVSLTWSANTEPDLAGYHVYRSTTTPVSTAGVPISGSAPLLDPTYFDLTAVNGTTYHYVVTAADTSANRSAGSNDAAATPDPAGGTALDFDGTNDYVTFGPAPGLGVTTFTIETWFRRDGTGLTTQTSSGTGGLQSVVPLVTKGRSESDGSNVDMNWFLGIRTTDNRLVADFEDNATGANHPIVGTTAVTSGVWHHAAATYDGTTWHLYLDGLSNGSLAVGLTPRSDSIQHAALGTAMDSAGLPEGAFDGVLDEVRVWNVARTGPQIATARDQQIVSGSGLIARWGMNEGAGSAVPNSIAGGAAGTAVNGPAWVPGAPFAVTSDPPPAPPTGLAAAPGPARVGLTWNANGEPDLAGYNVYRDTIVAGGSVTAVTAGDIASCSSTGDEATAALLDTIPGDVLALGDNVYENGTLTEFQQCYHPNWGRAKTRTFPTPGNHEYQTANAAGYYAYYGAAAGDPSKGYYSYDYGTWHVIVLNSNCTVISCVAGSAQEQWLRADLAANQAQCTVAYWHHPRFSSGSEHGNDANVAPFWDALYAGNADLILNGHEHVYERFGPQTPSAASDTQRGIRQFTVGTGGRSHTGFTTIRANSQVRNADTYGVLKLTLRPGGYDWQFVPEAGKTFTDSGSDVCHDANGPLTSGAPVNGGTPVTSPAFTDTSVVPGVQYHYSVTAVDGAGHESAASASVSATPEQASGRALDFDGADDYVTFGQADTLDTNTFTAETWFRRDGPGVAAITSGSAGGVTAIPLLTKGRSETGGQISWFLGIDSTTNRIAADFESASDDSNHGLVGITTLANGTWYHAAATYDGTTFRLYLNGVQEASVAVAAGPGTTGNHHAALGTALSTTGAPAGFFDGVIDEARVWTVARTAAQVATGKDQELTSGAGLAARWGLEEGSGSVVGNSIAGGPNGTAVGGPAWVPGAPFGGGVDPAPAAPTGLTASPGNGSVSLGWTANSEPDLAGYNVFRSTTSPVATTGTPLNGATPLTTPGFTDLTVANGTTYRYVVVAVDQASHASPPSSEASATPNASAGNALDFDGTNDHVTLGGASAFDSNTFTIETWFRRDGVGVSADTSGGAGGVTAIPLVTKGRSEPGALTNWFLGIRASDNRLAADFESASDDSNHAIAGTTTIQNGVWYHAAATYDGTTFRLFLNGLEEASVAVAAGPGTAANQPAALATALNTTGAAAGFFDGVLDEVRIWGVARTAAQLLSTRDQELTAGTGLMARYGLNEGIGTAVGNSVAAGVNGVAVNGPQWVAGAPFGGGGDPPPAAPAGLVAAPGSSRVDLSWAANSEPDLAGYNVYRSTALPVPTTGTPLNGGTLLTAPAYADLTAVDGTTYHYVVVAVDAAQQSSLPSVSSSATPGAQAGSALDFDGVDDYVTFGAASGLNSNTFTVETWFRRDGPGVTAQTSASAGGVTAVPLIAKGFSSGGVINWFLGVTADGRIAADYESASDDANHGIVGQTAISLGQWHHAAATYDGANFRVYLDGLLEESSSSTSGPGTGSAHHASLGTALSITGVPSGFFDGVLDEARVWNVAHTAAQIATGMSQQLTSGTGLIARWGMNEGTGAAVGNSIAGSPAGTAVGGPAWAAGAPFTPPPPPNLAPAAPVLVSPDDGATGVLTSGPNLSVHVSDPEGGALSTTFFGRKTAGAVGADFTIVALPDTQHYVDNPANLPNYNAQTQWIVANRAARNIAFVTHEGDVVEHADQFEVEWQRADAAMDVLDNAGIPNNLTTGNHDVNTSNGNGSFFDQYFPPSRYSGFTWYGGYLGSLVSDPVNRMNKNNYELFSAGGHDFIILHLELDVPDYAVDWAGRILDQYPNRMAIITTHLFVNTSNQRPTSPAFLTNGNSAEEVWQTLIRPHCNVFLVLNGHFPGEGRRTDLNACGNPVHQLLADYQERSNGGDGWLRILTFKPAENRIAVTTYSPTLNGGAGLFETDADSQFSVDVDLQGAGGFQPIATVPSTPSGGTATVAWPNLAGGTGYEWYAVASDGTSSTTGPVWSFTTQADSVAPAQPAGLVATPGTGTVSLAWTANTETDLAGYNVYRGTVTPVPTTGTPLNGATLLTSPSYVDATAVPGTLYRYVVTAVDASGNKSAASAEASATATAPAGAGVHFDGSNDYVTFGTAAGLGATSFTLETWFRRTGAGVGVTTGTGGIPSAIPLVTKGGAEAETPANVNMNYFLGIDAASGKLVADFEDAVNGGNHPVTGTAVVSSNAWHHAAATYDATSGTWKLYLDGVLDATLPLGTAFQPQNPSIQHAALGTSLNSTGAVAQSPGGFFAGDLDEVRIWSVARSAAEIAAARDLELASGTGLLARFGLNEGTGNTVASSVSSFPGTLTNGPTWVGGAPFSGGADPAPAAPTGLVATPDDEQVSLAWSANSEPDLAGYNVFRSTSLPVSTSGTPLNGATLLTVRSYLDTSLTNGTEYFYAVTAVDAGAHSSAAGSPVSATPGESIGHAVDLNGSSQFVTFGAAPALNVANLTLELWFKRTGAGVGTSTGNGG